MLMVMMSPSFEGWSHGVHWALSRPSTHLWSLKARSCPDRCRDSASPERCGDSPRVTQQSRTVRCKHVGLINVICSLVGLCCFLALEKSMGPEFIRQFLQTNLWKGFLGPGREGLLFILSVSLSLYLFLSLCAHLSVSLSLFLSLRMSLSSPLWQRS